MFNHALSTDTPGDAIEGIFWLCSETKSHLPSEMGVKVQKPPPLKMLENLVSGGNISLQDAESYNLETGPSVQAN